MFFSKLAYWHVLALIQAKPIPTHVGDSAVRNVWQKNDVVYNP
jgi:hypothetical protein